MTTAEALIGVVGFADMPGRDQVDFIVYGLTKLEGLIAVRAAQVSDIFSSMHLPAYGRISQYLSEQSATGRGKKPTYLKSKDGYRLTKTRADEVAESFPIRVSKVVISKSLTDLLPNLPDESSRSYLEEAMGCFTSNYLRASLVLTWCLTYDLFRSWLFTHHLPAINAKLTTRKDPISISKIEDFEKLSSERELIDTAGSAGAIGRELKKSLVQLLDERNSYAHPSGKGITPAIAEAFIERAVIHVIKELR